MSVCPECLAPLRPDGNCGACMLRMSTGLESGVTLELGNVPESLRAQFPQYELLRVVGRGGMGVIYQARQTSLDRDVAIKVIDRTISADTAFLDRFDREAKALARLSHPNIVAVYDYGRTPDGLAYLVMEYVHGLNLREAMQSMPIDAAYAIEIVEAVSQALEYAHSKGVVHRDIKPENILLSDDGRTKLADFGIAKINDAALAQPKITATNQVLGTAHYLAPEQLNERNAVDHRVDIYALGVILYELLTGQLPVGSFDPASRMNSQVGSEVDAVLSRALQQRPTARYQSVDEFRLALQKCGPVPPAASMPPLASLVEETVPSNASVPFFCEGWKGWSVIYGTLRAQADGLHIEYRSQDKFIGQIRSKLRAATIPWNRLIRVEFRSGIVHDRFLINGDSFNLLENLPGSEEGCLMLRVKRHNQYLALRVIDRVTAYRPQLVGSTPSLFKREGPTVVAIPVFCILLAILNLGSLAIAETIVATSATMGAVKPVATVFFAVCVGPIAIAQLVSGILYACTGTRAVGQVGALVSMIPLTPLALASIPFGMWAQKQLQPAGQGSPAPSSQRYGWGLTTVFFKAESKYAKLSSLIENAVCVIALCAVVLWALGLYPSTVRFRIVGQADEAVVSKFIDARLQGTSATHRLTGGHIVVSTWRCSREQVVESLAITEMPVFVICADEASTNDATSDATKPDRYMPALNNQLPKGVVVRSTAVGVEVATLSESPLDDGWFNAVQDNRDGTLSITWSREGYAKVRELLGGASAKPVMALAFDGWIEAVTAQQMTSDTAQSKTVTFAWLPGSRRSMRSLQAALRGPSLAVELEPIE